MKDQNYFREKLFNHTIPVKEDIWKHVEANLPPKRRRIPFLWLSLAGFLLLGASAIGVTIMQNTVSPDAPAEHNSIEKALPAHPTSAENEFANKISEPTKIASTETHKVALSSTDKTKQKYTRQKLSRLNSVPAYNASSDAVNADHILPANTYSNDIKVVSGLEPLDLSLLMREPSSYKMAKIKPDPSCYKFRGKNGKNALSIDVFAGPGFATRKFDPTEGSTSPYATARNQTEKSKYVWGAGARINLTLQQGFAVRLGISLEQIGDVFNYTDASATQSTTQIDSFFAADGTFLRADTNRVLIFGKLIKKIHNRYTHLDIPLLLSYELPMGRSTLMINAGPVLNLTSSVRGQILDPTLNPVHITPGEPDELKAYKNNLGLSLYLGAGALFPLTDNISALVEPRLLYRINPVTLDSYPLKEHRSTACLNLGIRYHFN